MKDKKMNDSNALMWIWFKMALHDDSEKTYKIYKYFKSIKRIYDAAASELRETKIIDEKDIMMLLNKDLYKAQEILVLCQQNKIDIIAIDDPLYPKELLDISLPPCVLFVYGNYDKVFSKSRVAIVGTRKCTTYGTRVTINISGTLASSNCTIVTGVAEGIDRAAYVGATKADGTTILVLPCGMLATKIHTRIPNLSYSNTVLLSEHLPTNPQTHGAYHERNRLISGLSVCTIVTQAPVISGALITADYTLEQGKELFVVPANVDIPQSQGTNNLLFQGATPFSDHNEILNLVNKKRIADGEKTLCTSKIEHYSQFDPTSAPPTNPNSTFLPLLSEKEREVLKLFGDEEITFDYLAYHTQMPITQLLQTLSTLQNVGAIVPILGNKYKINKKP